MGTAIRMSLIWDHTSGGSLCGDPVEANGNEKSQDLAVQELHGHGQVREPFAEEQPLVSCQTAASQRTF